MIFPFKPQIIGHFPATFDDHRGTKFWATDPHSPGEKLDGRPATKMGIYILLFRGSDHTMWYPQYSL